MESSGFADAHRFTQQFVLTTTSSMTHRPTAKVDRQGGWRPFFGPRQAQALIGDSQQGVMGGRRHPIGHADTGKEEPFCQCLGLRQQRRFIGRNR